MKYLLMIYGNEAAAQAANKADIEQMHAAYGAYTEAIKKAGMCLTLYVSALFAVSDSECTG